MAEPDRVQVTIETPAAHVPVLSYLLLIGAEVEQQKGRTPPWMFADTLTDKLIAAHQGVDVEDLDPQVLGEYLHDALGSLKDTSPAELRDLDRVDVDVEPVQEAGVDG